MFCKLYARACDANAMQVCDLRAFHESSSATTSRAESEAAMLSWIRTIRSARWRLRGAGQTCGRHLTWHGAAWLSVGAEQQSEVDEMVFIDDPPPTAGGDSGRLEQRPGTSVVLR